MAKLFNSSAASRALFIKFNDDGEGTIEILGVDAHGNDVFIIGEITSQGLCLHAYIDEDDAKAAGIAVDKNGRIKVIRD